ncbi:3'-5' exonuclease [Psychrosphaera aestuarii]|uniref:3'-5' exonuclease n=1 Tax=Psychrosphaera aestuarii TaxID=1266052 RepID=UPI001B33289D|nr:3'-5' exonuclease [Psychrosphaera aestuarii]
MDVQVAISIECMNAFASIPRNAQNRVLQFFSKFMRNPMSNGINYEKINNAADPSYRSVRIDQNFRGIVKKPDFGHTFLLVFVAKHDDAYDWACRKKCQVNEFTGSMQVFEANTTHIEEVPLSPNISNLDNSAKISIGLTQEKLQLVGIPSEYISALLNVTTLNQLESFQSKLPVEAYEAIYLSAMGESWENLKQEYCKKSDEAVDINDFAAALSRDYSQRFFKVIDGEEELNNMLSKPLEHWRVFLHSSQRRLVEKNWSGPVRVLGGAGTGKTVVAMHRAKWLAERCASTNEKVLLTTYTANLAADIKNNLSKICSAKIQRKIEVQNIDKWVLEQLRKTKYPYNILFNHTQDYIFFWEKAFQSVPHDLTFPNIFYQEEWEKVIVPQQINSEDDYIKAFRTGRVTRLNRQQRTQIWPVFEVMISNLVQKGYRTFNQAMLDAVQLIEQGKMKLGYQSVIVDEGQDMGPEALTLLRSVVPKKQNDLFIVGDSHQRIYNRKAIMSHCGIDIRGRGNKLKINYRTTEQTRTFASAILNNMQVDDMDGNLDSDTDYHSLTQGNEPTIELLESRKDEVNWLIRNIEELKNNEVLLSDVCVVFRIKKERDYFASEVIKNGVDVEVLGRKNDERDKQGVRFATMHRIKGLEFRYVFICSMNEGIMPLMNKKQIDAMGEKAYNDCERALFHVAATRAIKKLYVSSYGEPSPYLNNVI